MKKILTLFSVFALLSYSSLPAEESPLLPPLGREVVAEAKVSYDRGGYDGFIRKLKAEFERAGKAGLVKGAYQKMKAAADNAKKTGAAKSDWQEQDERLRILCAEQPDLDLCKRIDNAFFFHLTEEQEEALQSIESLRYKLPLEKKAETVEERISAIETHYRMLGAMLEIAFDKVGTDVATRIKKQEVLALDKFKKMQRVASSDPIWKKRVELAMDATEARLAQQLDTRVLKDIASGKIQLQTPQESEIAQVLREVPSLR